MSRSGFDYDGDGDQWATIRWKGALAAAKRGKQGQAFLKELLAALDAMPRKRLITKQLQVDGDQSCFTGYRDHVEYPTVIVGADELCSTRGTVAAMGEVCALGALGVARGLDMSNVDPEDYEGVAALFKVNEKIVQDIVDQNDEQFDWEWIQGYRRPVDGKWIDGVHRWLTPEERWQKMRDWIAKQIWEWKEVDE